MRVGDGLPDIPVHPPADNQPPTPAGDPSFARRIQKLTAANSELEAKLAQAQELWKQDTALQQTYERIMESLGHQIESNKSEIKWLEQKVAEKPMSVFQTVMQWFFKT